MNREEFEDKLIDLISEYITTCEDVDFDNENTISVNFNEGEDEVAIDLTFDIVRGIWKEE